MKSMKDIILQIERQWEDLLRVRSTFPTMKNNLIGLHKFSTAPYYKNMGFSVEFQFSKPLTSEKLMKLIRLVVG